ncbi:tetratricopeptide repeat protein [Micromonospora aurantiaca]|nr:tetratricopeptide repeat protein [Micromonospora aurantiaca]
MATQTVWALGTAPVQGSGIQLNFFENPDVTRGALASLAAPIGRIGGARPVRGREGLIARIEQARLDPDSEEKIWVLHGLGGVGKSATALAIARQAESTGADVWWMHAADADSLATFMATLASRLGASQEIRHRNVADLVWERLRVHQRAWLLVLDGLDNPASGDGDVPPFSDGSGWVRPLAGGLGCVVITSRESRPEIWGTWCRLSEVQVLSPDVAAQVLLDHAPHLVDSESQARSLGATLGGLPLALQMAGDALATAAATPYELTRPRMPRTFDEYRSQIEISPGDGASAGAEPATELLDVLASTWKISLDAVSGSDREDAVAMLGFLSCFADAPIPVALLLQLEVIRLVLPRVGTPDDVSRHLRSLESVGLLKIEAGSSEEGSREPFSLIYVHPLVRRCCRSDPRIRNDLAWLQSQATIMIDFLVSEVLQEANDWRLWTVLEPHVFDISAAMVATPGFTDIAVSIMCRLGVLAAKSLQVCGAYEEAGRRLRDVESLQRVYLPRHDERHLELSEAFASLARHRGNLDGAATAYRGIYNSCIRTYGLLHRKSIRVGAGLAGVLHQQGDAAAAGELLETILQAAQEGLGEHDRQTLALRANIACLLYEAGARDIAEERIQQVLVDQEAVLGPRAEDTLRTRLNLAQMYRFRGAFELSADEYATAIKAFDAVHGVWSLRSLNARISMAGLVRDQGDSREAERLYRSVLADAERFLGPDHLVTRKAARRLRSLVLRNDADDSGGFHGLAAAEIGLSATDGPPAKLHSVESNPTEGWMLGESIPEYHSSTLRSLRHLNSDAWSLGKSGRRIRALVVIVFFGLLAVLMLLG